MGNSRCGQPALPFSQVDSKGLYNLLLTAMDFLKAEIASQKRKVSPLDEGAAPVKKYMRKADIERMQREEEQRQLDEKKKEREKKLWQNAKKVGCLVYGATEMLADRL